ncbi:GNAT family N-acetyltransferase [Sporolactobacillus sp. STCC-11]|uniref:GNAT family N-acetyltransferase n=1 Tax=Sporolactobacillus caesalpiniae TaxID=3230362 RepID=UPI0033947C89
MEIRLMKTEDYAKVHQLWMHTDGMGMRSLDDSAQGIEKFLKRNPTTNFIAEENQQIMGVILCGNDGRRGYIYHTAVDRSYRRKGIGKQLVSAVINALKKEEINKIALVVFATNQSGNAFWQSIGFTKREDLMYRNLSINEQNI